MPQAPFKRLHFRSRRQKSFQLRFSLTHAHLELSVKHNFQKNHFLYIKIFNVLDFPKSRS
jgi:hypothetical protein